MTLKVIFPSKNRITQGYSLRHKGYDFSSRPDPNWDYPFTGQIIRSVNLYTNSWRNTGKLTTRDYGNFVIGLHRDGTIFLASHLPKDHGINVGHEFKAGERAGMMGNTGNSTGPHLHIEFRDKANRNIPVEFVDHPEEEAGKELESCMKDRAKFWKERDEARAELHACEQLHKTKDAKIVKLEKKIIDLEQKSQKWDTISQILGVDSPEEIEKIITDLRLAVQEQDCEHLVKEAESKCVKEKAEMKQVHDKHKELLKKQIKNLKDYSLSELAQELWRRITPKL